MATKLIIGLGGTGSRVVAQVAERIRKNGGRSGNDETTCIVIDADPHEDLGDEDGLRRFLACTPMRVRDCAAQYADFHPEEWLPQNPALMEESMMNGLNSRAKTRLGFLHFMKSGQSGGLIDCIDRLAEEAGHDPVHVQVVTSLCGNFGSGVFLQTALWIRRLLAERGVTAVDFTGFFLLPEIFVRVTPALTENPRAQIALRANTYAALRELNAAFQVRRNGLQPEEPFVIDDLFDASLEGGAVRGIYDYVYLIGDPNRNGLVHASLPEYEAMLADGIFARNYHPMVSAFFDGEAETYRPFFSSSQARYLSMGAAKAVYPTEEIREYCVLRGFRETVLQPWLILEPLMEAARLQADADQVPASEGELFLRAFGDLAARVDPARGAAFAEEVFLDTVNEKTVEDTTEYEDKTADFLMLLDEGIERALSGIEDAPLLGSGRLSEQGDLTRETLLYFCERDRDGLHRMLDGFLSEVDSMADRIVRQVMPPDPAEVNPGDPRTVFGYLTKTNRIGKTYAVHPLAARYLLYSLIRDLTELQDASPSAEELRECIFSYDPVEPSASFGKWDPACDPVEVLEALRIPLLGRTRALQEFAERYSDYLEDRKGRICRYRKAELRRRVCGILLPLLEELAASYEKAFREISAMNDDLVGRIAENASAEDCVSGNTLRVYATEGAKVKIFEELNFASWEDHSGLNEWVLQSCYGDCFARLDSSLPNNCPVIDGKFYRTLLRLAVNDLGEKIDADPNRRKALYLDVFTALRKQADLAAGAWDAEESLRNDRYRDELRGYRDRLTAMAAPFLKVEPDGKPGLSEIFSYHSWCLPQGARQNYPEVNAVLGKGTDRSDGCPENELICYRSAGGFEAESIPGLNEFREDSYYLPYRVLLEHDPDYGLHLDRRWSRILPCLMPDKATDPD